MSTRGARGLALLLAPVLWSACGGSRCPEGTYRDGPQCRPWRTDSGPPRDAGGGRRDSGPPVGVDAAAVDGSLDAAGPDASADASADGAVLDGAAGEGGTDAGPCGACPAERPLCALDRCVECTAVDTTRCPRGCDVAAGACLRDVCEPCFTDAQCGEGLLCAAESGDLPRCHWREDAPAPGPDGSCFANGRPFIESVDASAVGGGMVRVCVLGTSSCEAFLAYRTTSCATDDDCGRAGAPDGACVDADSGPMTMLRCTLVCATDDDCPVGESCIRATYACTL